MYGQPYAIAYSVDPIDYHNVPKFRDMCYSDSHRFGWVDLQTLIKNLLKHLYDKVM